MHADIIDSINTLINSFRKEENDRLPRITKTLNELIFGIELLISKSLTIKSEMERFEISIEKFKSDINDATSQVMKTYNEVMYIYFIYDS